MKSIQAEAIGLASREQVEDALDDKPDSDIECRGWGHAWSIPENYGPEQTHTESNLRFIEMTLTCLRGCGVERYDRLYWERRTKRWTEPDDQQFFGPRYAYPDGFLMPPGHIADRRTVREYRKNRGRNRK